MVVFLNGLALQNYRGIGPEVQKIGPFRQFNFFIGANNAGKSTVLNFIRNHLSSDSKQFDSLDRYAGGTKGQPKSAIGVLEETFIKQVTVNVGEDHRRPEIEEHTTKLVKHFAELGLIWLSRVDERGRSYDFLRGRPALPKDAAAILTPNEWARLWHLLTGSGRGDLIQHWVPQTLDALLRSQLWLTTKVDLIPAIREIGASDESLSDFTGRGLISRLAELQSPGHDKREDREAFLRINAFLRTVTGRDDAEIEIPHHRQHVLVHMEGKILPLASLGTGIHEVIMLAAFCNIARDQIVCVEEPEIHLHPILQRKLIKHLRDSTDNQYFIATHSASFIDTPDAAIFHVTNDGVQTRIRQSLLKKDRFAICADLGHRASDIIQSNAVIWVEGPSDRLYVRHWLAAVDPTLLEGTHYSIMFYGGRLLSHLSADDSEVTEFIQLRSLNRHLAILIDSDRTSPRAKINATKKRVIDDFESHEQSFAWLTKGREIENYIPPPVLQDAIRSLYAKSYVRPAKGGPYDHALHFYKGPSSLFKDTDKVKVAKQVCAQPADLSMLDLGKRAKQLVEMIRSANDDV